MTRFSDFATPSATRAILEAYGFSLKKSLGQNFLINDAVVGKILQLADVQPTDCILEVGPGIGTLTNALLKRAHHVTSVEKDPSLPMVLEDTLMPFSDMFTLVHKDALQLQASDVPEPFPNKLVANLPYAVAATVVLDYFQRFFQLESATVMVQREVAERMAACPGTKNYGAYTVKLALVAEPAGSFAVSRNDFLPPPHVDSTVIRLNRRGPDSLPAWATPEVRAAASVMADAAFSSRRKTIINSCKTFFAGKGAAWAPVTAALPAVFEACGIDPQVRGEKLTVHQYLQMGACIQCVIDGQEPHLPVDCGTVLS